MWMEKGQLQLAATVIYELIEETKFDSIIELASGNQNIITCCATFGIYFR